MNSVKKFETFEELKFCESKTNTKSSSLKKHQDFEKVMMDIKSAKSLQLKIEETHVNSMSIV